LGEVKIQPLGTRVLIRPHEENETDAGGGPYIPETAREKPQTGEVVAIGDADEAIKVSTGQKVLYPKYTGTEFKIADAVYLIMDANEILAIIDD